MIFSLFSTHPHIYVSDLFVSSFGSLSVNDSFRKMGSHFRKCSKEHSLCISAATPEIIKAKKDPPNQIVHNRIYLFLTVLSEIILLI